MIVADSLAAWMTQYEALAVTGVRSASVAAKIHLHLQRFCVFFIRSYGHDRLSACMHRDVQAWQQQLQAAHLAPATINNHLASLSAFTTWVLAHHPHSFPSGDPTKGIGSLGLPPLEPRALSDDQVRSLKNVCDRLPRFHQMTGRHWGKHPVPPIHALGRPWRDRAIVFVLLSTGLRREELVQLDLEQVRPGTPDALRAARRARIERVHGKGKTERIVFLSADARLALADYLERERPHDVTPTSTALFLSAAPLAARAPHGRLSPRAINQLLAHIGQWHDAEVDDPTRRVMPLRPHDLRHTFAFHLARVTGADAYELERRLGHRSQRYIQRYTNPPEPVAAGYIESF
ncbi:MAG: hypothetical protein NVS2B16_33940 [Chloroflexota bacterium]